MADASTHGREIDAELSHCDGSATPQWLFDQLNEQVRALTGCGFAVDAAASEWNAKCPEYWDGKTDALVQDWSNWKTIFVNPPFSANVIGSFVEKAIDASKRGSTVVLLVPMWPGYEWFQVLQRHAQLQNVIGPVRFENGDGSTTVLNNGYRTSPIVIATLGPHVVAGTNGPVIRQAGGVDEIAPQATENGKSSSGRRGPKLLTLAEIEPQNTEWLWEQRIPLGELTIVDGDPSANKSSMLLDLAARVSAGREMPDGTPGVKGGVFLMLGEDSVAKTVRRRLEVAAANLDRIVVPERQMLLPRDLIAIEESILRVQAKLVVLDPLMCFLMLDSNSDQKVRLALSPLHRIAERANCAIVMVRHLTKRGGRHVLYRGGGSIGIIAATRSGLVVGKSPHDQDLRVLAHAKCNLGPTAPSLLFEPTDVDGVPRIEWRGECEYTADDVLASPQPQQQSRLTEAMSFLTQVLAKGPVAQQEVMRRAVAEGLACRTIERAGEILGVVSQRKGWGPGSRCFWSLPPEPTYSPAPCVAFYDEHQRETVRFPAPVETPDDVASVFESATQPAVPAEGTASAASAGPPIRAAFPEDHVPDLEVQ